MGIYDYYVCEPSSVCPWCGAALGTLHSKEGDCAMVVWEQGQRNPLTYERDQRIDNCELDEGVVSIEGACERGHWLRAKAIVRDGIWSETDLAEMQAIVEERNERDRLRRLREA
ncbi:MAG: hypothetical protein QOI95_3080 [Acidimicrobiaceae bacterium]